MTLVHSEGEDAFSVPTETAPKTVADVLTAAAEIVGKPGAWTQEAFSRNADGQADCGSGRWASEPVCFCAIGAVAEAAGLTPEEAVTRGLHLPVEAVVGRSVPGWNDMPGRTQAEVVAALREAAAKAAEASQ